MSWSIYITHRQLGTTQAQTFWTAEIVEIVEVIWVEFQLHSGFRFFRSPLIYSWPIWQGPVNVQTLENLYVELKLRFVDYMFYDAQ